MYCFAIVGFVPIEAKQKKIHLHKNRYLTDPLLIPLSFLAACVLKPIQKSKRLTFFLERFIIKYGKSHIIDGYVDLLLPSCYNYLEQLQHLKTKTKNLVLLIIFFQMTFYLFLSQLPVFCIYFESFWMLEKSRYIKLKTDTLFAFLLSHFTISIERMILNQTF